MSKKYISIINKNNQSLYLKDQEAREALDEKLNISDVPEVIDSTEVAAAISEKIVSMAIDPTTGMVSLVLDDGNEEV